MREPRRVLIHRALIAAMVAAAVASATLRPSRAAQLPSEDALAEAYALFQSQFRERGFDKRFLIGFGNHPGLVTEPVSSLNPPRGQAALDLARGRISAALHDAGPGKFELWLVKNAPGGTVAPEAGDLMVRVGEFLAFQGRRLLDVPFTDIDFDLDMVVVSRAGHTPAESRIAVGSRTLLEKRFFRERAGLPMDEVAGPLSPDVETNDPLVRHGAHLYFNERFEGNGRTCGTCHRAENNLTLDVKLIARLPPGDPLFVAEYDPDLAGLEDPVLLRSRGLILENLDGFDRPGLLRGVQHTLAMSATVGLEQASAGFPLAPPDHRLGWGGDGAPGRGTLNEFAFGAVIQHFPRRLQRRPGVDFRVPTQAEMDALEAFLLFSGRQRLVDARMLTLRDRRAEEGRRLFLNTQGGGKCAACHLDLGGTGEGGENPPLPVTFNLATGTHGLTPELPPDDGFQGVGSFNVPPMIEAADTAPLFHNNAAAEIEDAVAFYVSDTFRATTLGHLLGIRLEPAEVEAIAAFLRVLNAAENVRQTRKRVEFVRDARGRRSRTILQVALADTDDALAVLASRELNPGARAALASARQNLLAILAGPGDSELLERVLMDLDVAKADLFASNPNDEF